MSGKTQYGKWFDFCRDAGSQRATIPGMFPFPLLRTTRVLVGRHNAVANRMLTCTLRSLQCKHPPTRPSDDAKRANSTDQGSYSMSRRLAAEMVTVDAT